MTITIKSPAVYDISHWKEVKDFSAINPRPVLIITKATEGTTIMDSKFIRFFDGMKAAGYMRGAYHFFRKAQSAVRQAQFFCDFIRPHIDDNTLLILDMEEGGESAGSIMVWFDYVRSEFPRNKVLLYSARYILEQMLMNTTQRTYFKSIFVWTAGYPANPDLYDYVPDFYIPDPNRFGPVAMWQYSAHGAVAGIEGDVDLNWISPAYLKILGELPTPPVPEPGETMQYKVVWPNGVTKRVGPTASSISVKDAGGQPIVLPLNQVVEVATDNIADATYPSDPNKKWVRFPDGSYGAQNYPNSAGVPQARMEKVAEPLDEILVTVDAEITATLNGRQYRGTVLIDNVRLGAV